LNDEILALKKTIDDLHTKIEQMQADLDKAHESGDEATNALRQQLQRAIEELESFKTKAK